MNKKDSDTSQEVTSAEVHQSPPKTDRIEEDFQLLNALGISIQRILNYSSRIGDVNVTIVQPIAQPIVNRLILHKKLISMYMNLNEISKEMS